MDSPALYPLMATAIVAGGACLWFAYAAWRIEKANRTPHDKHSRSPY